MTREQALDEPIEWLQIVVEVAAQERATAALYQLQATLGAVAPGALKNGSDLMRKIQSQLAREAGL